MCFSQNEFLTAERGLVGLKLTGTKNNRPWHLRRAKHEKTLGWASCFMGQRDKKTALSQNAGKPTRKIPTKPDGPTLMCAWVYFCACRCVYSTCSLQVCAETWTAEVCYTGPASHVCHSLWMLTPEIHKVFIYKYIYISVSTYYTSCCYPPTAQHSRVFTWHAAHTQGDNMEASFHFPYRDMKLVKLPR